MDVDSAHVACLGRTLRQLKQLRGLAFAGNFVVDGAVLHALQALSQLTGLAIGQTHLQNPIKRHLPALQRLQMGMIPMSTAKEVYQTLVPLLPLPSLTPFDMTCYRDSRPRADAPAAVRS